MKFLPIRLSALLFIVCSIWFISTQAEASTYSTSLETSAMSIQFDGSSVGSNFVNSLPPTKFDFNYYKLLTLVTNELQINSYFKINNKFAYLIIQSLESLELKSGLSPPC